MQKHGLTTSLTPIWSVSCSCKGRVLINHGILPNGPENTSDPGRGHHNAMTRRGQNMITSSDIVIIGGGPAGLAAATILGRKGIRVTVLDRQNLPADKVCGEGIMPPGVRILSEIGALPLISSQDFHPLAGISYRTNGGAQARG